MDSSGRRGPPFKVHQTQPLPPKRHYVDHTVIIKPDQMDAAVGEPPKYDPKFPQEQEVAKWIGWSARVGMAEALKNQADGSGRES